MAHGRQSHPHQVQSQGRTEGCVRAAEQRAVWQVCGRRWWQKCVWQVGRQVSKREKAYGRSVQVVGKKARSQRRTNAHATSR